VAGVTKNVDHRGRGSSLDNAASTARSAGLQIRVGDLTTQHSDLMTQNVNLDLGAAVRRSWPRRR
jgi:hypothetical protein